MKSEPALLSLTEVAQAIAQKRVPSREVTQSCLDRVAQWQPRLNAFMAIETEDALKAADQGLRRAEFGFKGDFDYLVVGAGFAGAVLLRKACASAIISGVRSRDRVMSLVRWTCCWCAWVAADYCPGPRWPRAITVRTAG